MAVVLEGFAGLFVVAFVIAIAIAIVLTRQMRTLATRYGLVDVPDGIRRRHLNSVPRGGGVPIFFSVGITLGAVLLVAPSVLNADGVNQALLPAIAAGAVAILLLGFADDVYDLTARHKFAFEVIIAAALWVAGVRIDVVNVATTAFQFHEGVSLLVTVLWIAGLTNAFNLIDGSDGIAAGAALFASLTMALIAALNGNVLAAVLSLTIAGATLGFLCFNFPPASIFLGDSGSLFLGYSMSVLAIVSAQKATTMLAIAIPVVSCGLPILDAALTIGRRFLRGQPIFASDRGHIHHRLQDLGRSPRQVALILYAVSASFAALSVLLLQPAKAPVVAVFIVAGIVAILALQRLRIPELIELHRVVGRGLAQRTVIAHNLRIREAAQMLSEAGTLQQVEQALTHAFSKGEFAHVQLEWRGTHGKQAITSIGSAARAAKNWEISLPFRDGEGDITGALTLWASAESDHLLTDLRLIAHELQPAIATVLNRMPLPEEKRIASSIADRREGVAAKPGLAQAS